MTENVTYCDKHVSSRKCLFFVVVYEGVHGMGAKVPFSTHFWVFGRVHEGVHESTLVG